MWDEIIALQKTHAGIAIIVTSSAGSRCALAGGGAKLIILTGGGAGIRHGEPEDKWLSIALDFRGLASFKTCRSW